MPIRLANVSHTSSIVTRRAGGTTSELGGMFNITSMRGEPAPSWVAKRYSGRIRTCSEPHERRTLLYKYCVSHMAWSRARVQTPPDVKLTARQEALLIEPADPHTFVPSLFDDGPGAAR